MTGQRDPPPNFSPLERDLAFSLRLICVHTKTTCSDASRQGQITAQYLQFLWLACNRTRISACPELQWPSLLEFGPLSMAEITKCQPCPE